MLKSTELVWMESNGDFKVKAGPDMESKVFGHCAFLHPNRNKVVVAGGFDGTNQYMTHSEEFHLGENSWSTRPWSGMKTGKNISNLLYIMTIFIFKVNVTCINVSFQHVKIILGKIDHACFTHNGHGYVAGGWNNDFIGASPNMTEKYDHGSREWNELLMSQKNLPHMLRSSGYTVLNNKPTLIGGVGCMINTGGRTTCTKDTDVYSLSNALEWEKLPGFSITTPRSSHLVLTVPVTSKFGCDLIPTTTTAAPTTTAGPTTTCGGFGCG